MGFTPTLRASAPRFPLDIHPLARMLVGRLDLLQAAFPPLGPAHLVIWRPGEDPPFTLVEATITRDGPAWRIEPPLSGYVVLWARAGDPP